MYTVLCQCGRHDRTRDRFRTLRCTIPRAVARQSIAWHHKPHIAVILRKLLYLFFFLYFFKLENMQLWWFYPLYTVHAMCLEDISRLTNNGNVAPPVHPCCSGARCGLLRHAHTHARTHTYKVLHSTRTHTDTQSTTSKL